MLIRYSYIILTLLMPPQVMAIQDPTCFATSLKLDTKRKRNRIKDANNVIFQYNNNIQSDKISTNLILFSTIRGGDSFNDSGNNDQTNALSASLFLTYLTVMAAKCALPSTLALLTATNSGLLHHNTILSRQDVISRLLALSTVSIATGKLLLGPIIDSLGGMSSLQIALTILFLCLGSSGTQTLCPTLISFAIYWIIVDFAFSACWAACVKTIRDYLPEESWSREIGRLAMAARLGNTISFTAFASLLQWTSTRSTIAQSTTAQVTNSAWRLVYRASSIIQLIPLFMLTYFGKNKSRISDDNIISKDNPQMKSKERSTLRQSLLILGQESRTLEFWLHLISRSIIMVLVSFLLFIPSYMTQCFEMSAGACARVGSAFAMGCLLAVSSLSEKTYPSDVTRERSSRSKTYRRKAFAMTGFLTTATICLMLQTSYLQNMVSLTPALGTLLMFLFGFSLGEY